MTLCLGVLISGRGSNFQAIVAAINAGTIDATIGVVISNNPSAAGLKLAEDMGVPAVGIDPAHFADRASYEASVVDVLQSHHVHWIVLAGYMKLVGRALLGAYPNQIINIHPSLLPAFKGLDAQQQALDAGATVTGCTVHIVTRKMDDGPVLGQRTVPIRQDDTLASLTQRILVEEHQLLPEVIRSIAKDFKG